MNKIKWMIVMVSMMLVLSSCSTFSGYYDRLEDARKESPYAKHYNSENLIFSKELSDGVIDFIIDDDSLHIVCIAKQMEAGKDLFQIKSVASFSIDEQIQAFQENEQYHFHDATELAALPYSWCIVTKQYNESNQQIDSFEFEHDNQLYHLCIPYVMVGVWHC